MARKKKNENECASATAGLGDKLRALREEKGLSLKKLGELTQLSFTYLSEVERGTVAPSVETLRSLADVLDVPVSVFIRNQRKHNVLSKKLQYIRKIKSLSQKELAAKAGISPGLVAQLELGQVNASLKTLEKLSSALGVSVCYLLLDQDEVEAIVTGISPELRNMLTDPKVQAVIGSICALDEEKLKLALNFINMLKEPAL
ncbi:MAG: helix-turn-helix domain-containing protein [Bacillota bacterium]